MKYIITFLGIIFVALNLPTLVCFVDMFTWFFTDHTFSGIVYGTSSRPLIACAGSFISVFVAMFLGNAYL